MIEAINRVREFMEGVQEVRDNPTAIPVAEMKLRFRLGLEELTEYAEACGIEVVEEAIKELQRTVTKLKEGLKNGKYFQEPYVKGIFDSVVDQGVVLFGTVNAHGMHRVYPEGYNRIMDENMSKFIKDEPQQYMTPGTTIKLISKSTGDVYALVEDRPDAAKILKPSCYRKAKLDDLLIPRNSLKQVPNRELLIDAIRAKIPNADGLNLEEASYSDLIDIYNGS